MLTLGLLALALCGCVDARPVIDASHTVPPTATPTAEPTPEPTPSPTPTPQLTPTPAPVVDALGNFINGADHFKRYISFRNVQVYEQEDDTFVDAIAVNEYTHTLTCALLINFYDGDGELVADGRMQTRDAQYILILPPGETTLFARVDTDMTLTSLDIELVFDDELGVKAE